MSPKAAPPTIVVRGQAVVRTDPDEASLSIDLNAFAESPGAALEDIAARSQKLSTLLDELEVAEADRATTGVSVRSRAVAYATGIGAQLGRLISLEEPDAGPATHRVTRRSVMPLAAGSDMPIETEDQEVWAFVDATFEMTAASVDSA